MKVLIFVALTLTVAVAIFALPTEEIDQKPSLEADPETEVDVDLTNEIFREKRQYGGIYFK